MQLTPGRIRSVCFTYNTGRQMAQREASTSSLGKFAEFALVDPDKFAAEV